MDRDPATMLDIVLACRRLKSFVVGRSREDLDRDELLQYATLHAIVLIGDGANRLSVEFQQAHPEIPWKDVIGTRNRIIHGYDNVKLRRGLGHRDREGRALARTIGTFIAPSSGVKNLIARKKTPTETKVESIRHKDKRTNIPTEELRDFIADDEQAPKTMLYPRDPSLDPQLVWRGKDEQDRQDLAVPVVPIYIQEKIHPQAIIDDLMAQRQSKPGEQQLSLFNDFNGLDDFDKKIDFYHHAQHWSNRMILGDSLLVMSSLAQPQCMSFCPLLPRGANVGREKPRPLPARTADFTAETRTRHFFLLLAQFNKIVLEAPNDSSRKQIGHHSGTGSRVPGGRPASHGRDSRSRSNAKGIRADGQAKGRDLSSTWTARHRRRGHP